MWYKVPVKHKLGQQVMLKIKKIVSLLDNNDQIQGPDITFVQLKNVCIFLDIMGT